MEKRKTWKQGKVINTVRGIQPRLASWDKKTNPSQIRLKAYLDEAIENLGPLPDSGLFLHLNVDVGDPQRLVHHYDLENYLTPLANRLGHHRFVNVSAQKQVGEGSHITVGWAEPSDEFHDPSDWGYFSGTPGSGAQQKD
jgi:hypothetical protein